MVRVLVSSTIFSLMLLLTMAWDFRQNLDIPRMLGRQSANVNYTKIIDFWKQHKEKLVLHGKHEEVVLVMGNTGAGKTTVISALIGKKLRCTKEDGYLVIVDDDGKIGNNPSSQTHIPELMTDIRRNVTYADCSGFRDNRDVEYEISSIYFQNILMNQVGKIKLVFVINYDSLKINGNKNDFDDLLEHISEFIEDISKFHDGIALVVTKVENIFELNSNGSIILSNDDQLVLKGIEKYLKKKKEIYLSKADNPEKYKIFANLIDVLLLKKNELYSRISLFRQPMGEGLLEDLPKSKSEIDAIAKMTMENLLYIKKTDDDFGFALPKSLTNTIEEIVDDIYRDALMKRLSTINVETLRYYSQMEKDQHDIRILQERVLLAYDVFYRMKISDEPQEFFKELIDAANTLNVPLSLTNLNIISDDIEKLHFFTAVLNNTEDTHMLLLKNQMQKIKDSIENLKNFYDFLNNLQDNLATHKSQYLRQDNRIVSILSCTISTCPAIQNITNLKDIAKEIASDKLYQKIESMRLNKSQLKHLQSIFRAFVIELRISINPSSEQMTATGYNVRMSDVVENKHWAQAKNIQVFALNKVFIDCNIDKIGAEAQLFIFAPTWDVIGGPKIILDGKAGESHNIKSIESSFSSLNDGSNGLPGLPGSPAGYFFGVGKQFINSEYLEIHANGGPGGAGQQGGKGTDGIPGKSLPELFFDIKWKSDDMKEYFKKNNFNFDMKLIDSGGLENIFWYYLVTVSGELATKPGNGGDGGTGGKGGFPGGIIINSLGQSNNIKTFNYSGSNGSQGEGGQGGKETLESRKVQFNYMYQPATFPYPAFIEYSKIQWENGAGVPAGTNGKDGINNKDEKSPISASIPSPCPAINSFKDFVRMNLFENIKENELKIFIYELENNDRIKAQYNTLAFVKEYEGLESQFLELRNIIDFVPFYDSFLTRVEEFAKSEQNLESKKVLNYIYTAALTKVFTLKKKRKGKTVVNLSKYLNIIEKTVNEIQEAQQLKIIQNYRDDYKNTLYKKIQEAEGFIQNKIEPEIDKLWKESDKQLKAIVDEINEYKNSAKDAILLLEKNKAENRHMMQMRGMLLPLKLAGACLSFFGPIGAGVGTAITGAASIAEGMLISDTPNNEPNKVPSINPDLKEISRVTKVLNGEPQQLGEKLTEVVVKLEEYEKELSAPEQEKIKKRQTISTLKTQLQKAISTQTNSISDVLLKLNHIKGIEKNLTEFTNSERDILESKQKGRIIVDSSDEEKKNKHSLLQIKHVETILNAANVIFDFVKEVQNDETKTNIIDKQMAEYYQQLKDLEKMERQVYDIIVPDLLQIEETINEVKNSINGSSHAKLDITKWTVRTTLKDVKSLLQKFTVKMSHELRSNLDRYMEKIDEGFSILIDIYDRIDSYLDSVQQAEYMAHIESASMTAIQIKNPQLNDAVIDLKLIIQSNILFEKYGIAMHAFKQHFYPFAAHVLQKFELPKGMQLNNTTKVKSEIINILREMQIYIDESEALLGEYSEYIHEKKIFNGNTTGSSPFYVWKHDTIKNDVQRLLNGSEILLKADISEGLFYNSIKYNDIGIYFKLNNKTLQDNLTLLLENFSLTMTMIGNNYYRCSERYYFISFDDDITISYTLKQDEGKNWINPNKVYTTIRDSHTFLSPYVMWSIKLGSADRAVSFVNFEVFANETIDLELIGRGYYIEQHPDFNFEVCNEYLETFYNIENIVKEIA